MRSSLPQSKYRGRGEIGRVYLPSQMERSLLYNFVRDGRQSERWWAMGMHPPTLTRLGKFFHHYGMYARKWSLPLYNPSIRIQLTILFIQKYLAWVM